MNYTDGVAFEKMRDRLLAEATKMADIAVGEDETGDEHYTKQSGRYLALAEACDILRNPPDNPKTVREAVALLSDMVVASSLDDCLKQEFWTFKMRVKSLFPQASNSTEEGHTR